MNKKRTSWNAGIKYREHFSEERFKEISNKIVNNRDSKKCGFAVMDKKKLKNISKKAGLSTQRKYPETGKNLGAWIKKHPECASKAGKISQQKNGSYLVKWHKDNKELVKKLASENIKRVNKKYPNLCKQRGFNTAVKQTERGKFSKAEKIMRNLLPEDFLHGKQLADVGVPDFHSPERKIVIEVDGVYWHSLPEVIERDKRHTEEWLKMGYQVYRIKDIEVHKYLEGLFA